MQICVDVNLYILGYDVLFGRIRLMAFGDTIVEVSIKKINSKNTRSDIDVALNVVSTLFCILIAMALNF